MHQLEMQKKQPLVLAIKTRPQIEIDPHLPHCMYAKLRKFKIKGHNKRVIK